MVALGSMYVATEEDIWNYSSLKDCDGNSYSHNTKEDTIDLMNKMDLPGRDGMLFVDLGNELYAKVSLWLWGDVYLGADNTEPNMEKAGDILEALLGITIWILRGKPLRQTPFNPRDVILMLAPETDYFRKLSTYMIHFDWMNRVRNGLLKGTTVYPSISRIQLRDQQFWDKLRADAGDTLIPRISQHHFLSAMRSRWGIAGFYLNQEDVHWWWHQMAILNRRMNIDG